MSILRLPPDLRPRHSQYKKCELGVDLPAEFVRNLRSIDEHLYPVFHNYRLLWDDIINEYYGSLEDPRYIISEDHGALNFGHVLTNGKGVPTEDGSWHIWRLCWPHGWAHVINIDSTDTQYLNLLVTRLWLQAEYNDKYGNKGYAKLLEQADEAAREKAHQDKVDMMNEISKVNSSMLSRAKDNFSRGITKATNPQKETIFSGAGISKRSRTSRPLSDREGGLILPPGYGDE